MALAAAAQKKRQPRHPLWSKEALKQDLRQCNTTLTEICRKWSADPDKWQGLYNEIRIWRKQDPELNELIILNTKATDSKKRTTISGGRKPKDLDPEDHSWRYTYCEVLLAEKGNRNKAALVTPYSPDEIYKKLNERYTEYDREFADMVHLTEMQLVAWAESEIWSALEDATTPKDRAWIAKEILKVRDRARWGDKLALEVTGSVQHQHMLQQNKEALLIEASKDLTKLFGKKEPLALPEPQQAIDVEVVHVEVEPVSAVQE